MLYSILLYFCRFLKSFFNFLIYNFSNLKKSSNDFNFTGCRIENREFITSITENNEHLNRLAQYKKGKRFSLPNLIL